MTPQSSSNPAPLKSAVQKARHRLAPFLALMFAMAMIDRSNVGFVKQALEIDAHLNNAAYALGAGIFFIGYAVFEIPSNLMLHRVGAKIWLSRIMITWGLASAAMMFVRDEWSFYGLRFILGVSEAGFSPGVILFSTYWFPAQDRSKALGIYYLGAPIAMVLGGPISGFLLESTQGLLNLKNWQWMFLIEGFAAVFVGIIAYFYLVSRPRDAKWLTAEEKTALGNAIASEDSQKAAHGPSHSIRALFDLNVLRFVLIYFTIQVSAYGVVFYLPSRVSELIGQAIGLQVGILTAIPWLCALLSMSLITGYADKHAKHRPLAISLLALTAGGLFASTLGNHIVPTLVAFSLATVGFVVVQPLFWTMPTAYLTGTAAASGIALIGSIGNLGGYMAPTFKTKMDALFQNHQAGTISLAFAGVIGMFLLLSLKPTSSPSPRGEPESDKL
ncbi:MAG: MFS transporter [Verrucomicrobiota bacterium]